MPRSGWLTLVSGLSVSSIAFAENGAPDAAHVLRAASGSSPRPAECRATGADRGHTLWDRARDPRLSRYCDLLAKGYARLEYEPLQALEAAERAKQLEPARPAPVLLQARALVGLGRMAEAYQTFQQVLTRGSSLELSPAGLYAYAVAAVGSGQTEQGLAAYRRVVPMASLLTGAGAGERVYVEAAVLVMQQGPAHLQEAVAYLNEARRRNASLALRPFVLSALALALDRQGRHEEARGVAREAHGHTELLLAAAVPEAARTSAPEGAAGAARPPLSPGGAASGEAPVVSARVRLPRVAAVELLAMAAMLATGDAAELARQYWKEFVERAPPNHPWLGHARAKLAARG